MEPHHDELRRWLAGIADIGAAVSRQEPLGDLLNRVAETACSLMGYDFCGVFLPNPEGTALVIRGYHGLSPEYVDLVNAERPILLGVGREGEAPTSRAFRTGDIVALEDIGLEPRFGPWGGVAQEQGYRALVSVPLCSAGTVVGTLNCYRQRPHHFDDAERELVGTLATQVAIALVTAQLQVRERATIGELRELNRSLSRQHALLRRAEEIHVELTAIALRGEGIGGVVTALADLLGSDVLADDAHGSVLARSDGRSLGTDAPPSTAPDLTEGSLVETTLEGETFVVSAVLLDGEVVGRIWVRRPLASFTGLDIRATEHASVVAALELLRERTAADVEGRLRGSLVADLLSDESLDVAAVVERARRMGHDLTGPHTLSAIAVRETDGAAGLPAAERALATITRLLAGMNPPPLAAAHRGLVVVLWPDRTVWRDGTTDTPREATERLAEVLGKARSVRQVTAAVAASTPTLPGLRTAFRTARGALELAAESPEPVVLHLAEPTVDNLLLQVGDTDGLRRFARRVLGPVLDYDRERSTDLVTTLRVLVENDMDRRAAARELHIHPNTVLQRMRRIEDLTALKLSRPRDLLEITTSLAVARIAGLRDPRLGRPGR
ncbi:helix-turn-helix domain-containing protein [Streptosporangium sp. NPDC000509]|uniref:helix-turn-helix domain-containing protein n=1 Tax=Streptosporangium sp. NPDC000509 TaxID=3366186 RepID=UPI0036BB60C3